MLHENPQTPRRRPNLLFQIPFQFPLTRSSFLFVEPGGNLHTVESPSNHWEFSPLLILRSSFDTLDLLTPKPPAPYLRSSPLAHDAQPQSGGNAPTRGRREKSGGLDVGARIMIVGPRPT